MSQQNINIGTANDRPFVAWVKVQANFTDLYTIETTV